MNITVGFIATQEEFNELTERYRPVSRGTYTITDFSYDGPKIYFYRQYSEERGCRCGSCEDDYTMFYTSEKELFEIVKKLKCEIAKIESQIKLIDDGKNINRMEIQDDYIPEQRFRDWM